MIVLERFFPAPTDTERTARLRQTAHGLGTLGQLGLLTFGSELALGLLPSGPERDQGLRALGLAAQVAAGEAVKPISIVDALHDEQDEGVMLIHQEASPGVEADAWATAVGVLGYAACSLYLHAGRQPNGLVEGWDTPDALDFCIDPFVGLEGLDWAAMERAEAYAARNAARAPEIWGPPLRVEDLRRAALPAAA